MRKDGKFVRFDGTIPVGQDIVMAHLNECHELLEMVRSISRINLRPGRASDPSDPISPLLAKGIHRQCQG